jgi:hypothetical protein
MAARLALVASFASDLIASATLIVDVLQFIGRRASARI